jgi:protein-S-isoprenylcysteine O-methyltransferase Ste14
MPRGRFRHESIAAAEPVQGERVIGWTAHYLIGIAFAAILPGVWGLEWIRHPTLVPALIVGIGTVAAPMLVMQPGMGAGIGASRTPRPAAARLQSLATHTIFGLGLYAAGWATSFMCPP